LEAKLDASNQQIVLSKAQLLNVTRQRDAALAANVKRIYTKMEGVADARVKTAERAAQKIKKIAMNKEQQLIQSSVKTIDKVKQEAAFQCERMAIQANAQVSAELQKTLEMQRELECAQKDIASFSRGELGQLSCSGRRISAQILGPFQEQQCIESENLRHAIETEICALKADRDENEGACAELRVSLAKAKGRANKQANLKRAALQALRRTGSKVQKLLTQQVGILHLLLLINVCL
jgi:hypothetical protein